LLKALEVTGGADPTFSSKVQALLGLLYLRFGYVNHCGVALKTAQTLDPENASSWLVQGLFNSADALFSIAEKRSGAVEQAQASFSLSLEMRTSSMARLGLAFAQYRVEQYRFAVLPEDSRHSQATVNCAFNMRKYLDTAGPNSVQVAAVLNFEGVCFEHVKRH
jgi:hypothetical protein